MKKQSENCYFNIKTETNKEPNMKPRRGLNLSVVYNIRNFFQ